MKKIFLFCLLISLTVNAQDKSLLTDKKNEIRIDLLSIITTGKFGISYERFLKNDFSVGINANFLNSSNTQSRFDAGFRNNLPAYEINPYVRYALSKSKKSYYFAEIFTSVNGGDFKEIIRTENSDNTGSYQVLKSTYSDFGIGGSLGYKMYVKEKIAIEFLVGYGYNLFNTEKSPDRIARVGINLGYRF